MEGYSIEVRRLLISSVNSFCPKSRWTSLVRGPRGHLGGCHPHFSPRCHEKSGMTFFVARPGSNVHHLCPYSPGQSCYMKPSIMMGSWEMQANCVSEKRGCFAETHNRSLPHRISPFYELSDAFGGMICGKRIFHTQHTNNVFFQCAVMYCEDWLLVEFSYTFYTQMVSHLCEVSDAESGLTSGRGSSSHPLHS